MDKYTNADNSEIVTDLTEIEVRELLHDVFRLTHSLIKESERASAIIAGARLDVDLERLLKHVLHPHTGASDPLFDSDRAIGTFSAKIALSYRLGIIDHGFEHGLQLVRKIRNDFAHQLEEESLSSQRQKPRLAELVRWIEKLDLYQTALKVVNSTGKSVEQIQFTACIACMVAELKRGLRNSPRLNIAPALGFDSNLQNNRVLFTPDQLIESRIKNHLVCDQAFANMQFIIQARDGKIELTRLPSSSLEKPITWQYSYSIPENGKFSVETKRLKLLIDRDVHSRELIKQGN